MPNLLETSRDAMPLPDGSSPSPPAGDSHSSILSSDDGLDCSTPSLEGDLECLTTQRVDASSTDQSEVTTTERRMADRVMAILYSYSPAMLGHAKIPKTRANVEYAVRSVIKAKARLHLILPAFPFKSPNKVEKVLGALPDMGEHIALARLNGLCAQIQEVYPDTSLTIISDGLVYNDILGVSDTEVWNYGTQLRQMANGHFSNINFARLSSLVSSDVVAEPSTLDEYFQTAQWYREELTRRYLPEGFDVNSEMKTKEDMVLTYRGYIKFLTTDLKHEQQRQGLSNSKIKTMNELVAKQMIRRGAAFANAIRRAFPTSIRLSIHVSKSGGKLPVALLSNTAAYTTPWHSTCALELDGTWRFAHSDTFAQDPEYELLSVDGKPSHYRRKSDLYTWSGCDVDIMPLQPCGLLITPRKKRDVAMGLIDMQKARYLAELNSPLVFRGFTETKNRDLFISKAREMGSVMPWKFGELLVVKDAGNEGAGLNNVLSAEAMPMHFDGLFKTKVVVDQDGNKRLVPQPPRFQWFTVSTPAPRNCGQTLIASSRLLFSHLPAQYQVEDLRKLTWTVSTSAFSNATLRGLDLVVPHPTLGTPCLRYHEPWPATRTCFDPSHVSIDDMGAAGEELISFVNKTLYDRRVCYYHEWVEGDLVLSDNVSMMHTRTGFSPGAPRELWRIHID